MSPLTPMQFNDLFCLQRPEIDTISIGASCPEDFEDHLNTLPMLEDHGLVQNINEKWQKAMEESSGFSSPDALWQKFPPWQQAPGYINIGFILWLYNLTRGWDLLEFAHLRYKKLGQRGDWVPGNDGAAADRYQLDDIARPANMTGAELTEMLLNAHDILGEK